MMSERNTRATVEFLLELMEFLNGHGLVNAAADAGELLGNIEYDIHIARGNQ